MTYKRKSWKEKMNPKAQWKIEVSDKKFSGIPEGRHTSLAQMRKDLAAEYHAEYMCPVTAGIFLRIVAEKAYEEYLEGKSLHEIAPFWRIIDKNTSMAKKLTFGTDFINKQRKSEDLPV